MRALEGQTNRQRVARPIMIPAPTSGWFVQQNLAEPPPRSALVMDNWFPAEDVARLRNGTRSHATGLPAGTAIETLMTYRAGASEKMFAATGTVIHDVSSPGAVGAAVCTGLTSARFEWLQFATSGASFLVLVNGADDRQLYDGSTWSTSPAITGIAGSSLNNVWAYRNRLFFVEKSSLNAWYLPVDSVGGAASLFALGGVVTLGGELVAGAAWSVDAGDGLDDKCVFITSEGEVAVYKGAFPGDAATWSLQGVYRIGRPLGRRCVFKAGGDIAILTDDGIVPLSKAISLDRIALSNEAISQPIAPAWRDAVRSRVGLFGWSITPWPRESLAIVNLPQATTDDRTQFVTNLRTGAWGRYLGWNASSWGVLNNKLYYGEPTGGRVMEAEAGGSDDGLNYTGTLVLSWNSLRLPARTKEVKLVRPLLTAAYPLAPQITMLTDYLLSVPLAPAAGAGSPAGAIWGTSLWGVGVWGETEIRQQGWVAAPGVGTVFAPTIQISASQSLAPNVRLTSMEILFEPGEVVS